MTKIPEGWAESTIPEIAEVLDTKRIPINSDERATRVGGKPQKSLVAYYGATGQVGWIDTHLFNEDLVLLGEDGVPFLDPGKPKAYRVSGKSWVNNHAHVLRARQGALDWRLLEAQLNTLNYTGHVTGSTRLKLTQGAMNKLSILVPPLDEQKRIADKLDTVLTRVDAVNTRLARVAPLLKRFRQSVLAAATSGRLTEDWRETEDLPSVTEQVLKARRLQHATSSKDTRITSDLIERGCHLGTKDLLPETWLCTCIGMIGIVSNGSTPSRAELNYWGGKIPWVSSGEVRNNRVSTTKESISQQGFESSSVKLLPAGAVLVAMIGEGKTRGQSALLDVEATINQNIAAVAPTSELIESEYLWFWFQSQYEANRLAGNGTGPQALNCQKVRELPLNLPPKQEQTEIVRRVETLFAFADRLEARLAQAQTAATRLTPALLAKAFRGELVPQDPNDEPATELLRRLAQAPAAASPRKGRKVEGATA